MGGPVCEKRGDRVSSDVMSMLLNPYFPSCRYLKSATFENGNGDGGRMGVRGEFSIPSSCYIESTGHFNAVEFVICFNQLSYVLFGEAVERGLVPELRVKTLAEFVKEQLSKVYITKSEMSFRKPIDAMEFNGSVYVRRRKTVRTSNFYFVDVVFGDSNGGKAKGAFSLVMV